MKHRFDVRDVCLTGSSGSYIVKYSAELETSPGIGDAIIEVLNTIPDIVDEKLMNLSLEQIRIGVEEALGEQRLDWKLTLNDLVIHDVDCNPYKFRRPTTDAIRELGLLA